MNRLPRLSRAAGWTRLLAAAAPAALLAVRPLPAQPVVPDTGPSPYVHEAWTVEDGLPVNSVNDLLQARDGYLWLATFDGLVRFDGVGFTVFNVGNSEGLPSSRILSLALLDDGSLWMRTENDHLVRYHHGSFESLDRRSGLPADRVTVLHVDRGQELLVGTERGAARWRDGRFERLAPDRLDVPITSLLQDASGAVWLGTGRHGLYRVTGKEVERVGDESHPETPVTALLEDRTGTVWIAADRSLYRWREGSLRRMGPPDGLPGGSTNLHTSAPDTVWVGTSRAVLVLEGDRLRRAPGPTEGAGWPGIVRADRSGRTWYALGGRLYRDERLVVTVPTPLDSVLDRTGIRAFTWDHEGSLWIATHTAGLHRLKPSLFRVYGEPEGVAFDNIYPIYEDRSGALWLGTWGRGLSRLAGGRVESFPLTPGSSFVLSVLEDREGRLWVGAHPSGLLRCQTPPVSCEIVRGGPGAGPVRALHQDRHGALWAGSEAGLFRLRSGVWERLGPGDGAPPAPVRAFHETADGTLFMATYGAGVAAYRDGRFTHLTTSHGLPGDLVRAVHVDAGGILWVGTEGWGLARVESPLSSPRVTSYRARHGLFDEVIHRILEDDFGRLWMSGNRGIFWVHREELTAFARGELERVHSTSYTERDGLRNREANGGMHPAGLKASDGRLWFPTQSGAVVVDPAYIRRNEVPPPVRIERVTTAERTLAPEAAGPLELSARERDLRIDYTALSFMAPENVRFRYRLDGYKPEWVEAGGRRTAFYTNLPPGRYTFRAVASNNDGVWNREGAATAFRIRPHLHETTGFQVALLATLGLLGAGGVRWRVRTLRRRERHLAALVERRTAELGRHEELLEEQNRRLQEQAERVTRLERIKSDFFANISHEFRTPLTLIIGPLEDLRRAPGAGSTPGGRQLELALRNARRLLRLINQMLDVARLEAGEMRLRARELDLTAWLRNLAVPFEPAAERRRIDLRVGVPERPVPAWFDPELAERIMANLLGNALKFTPEGGVVELRLELEPRRDGAAAGRAAIRVLDTGPGIPVSEAERVFDRFYTGETASRVGTGTGIGLSVARELAELHGGSLELEERRGWGACFLLRLPLGRGHLSDDQVVETGAPWGSPPTAVAMAEEVGEALTGERSARDGEETLPADEAAEDVTTVLVVEDNQEVRSYIRSHLAARFRVLEAADGAEGIELARTALPDLVISDVMMPGTDGLALCRALKANPETDFIPVILLTARAEVADRVEGLEGGADDYVVKPFDMRELEARVLNAIESRRRLRERFAVAGAEPRGGGAGRVIHASPVEVTNADAAYLERVRHAIETHLGDDAFGVAELAREVRQDRSHLYRRLRELSGEAPAALIKRLRLERAAQLLEGGAGTVGEVAYAVGFRSVSHFCKAFRETHGVTPARYRAAAGETGVDRLPADAAGRSPAADGPEDPAPRPG